MSQLHGLKMNLKMLFDHRISIHSIDGVGAKLQASQQGDGDDDDDDDEAQKIHISPVPPQS